MSAERHCAELTQTQLAELVGISQQWVSRIERGTVNANFATVQRIFEVLGRELRVEAVQLGADMDVEIDRGLAICRRRSRSASASRSFGWYRSQRSSGWTRGCID
jgi:transcriptional regulator with XRE-family HTH domain